MFVNQGRKFGVVAFGFGEPSDLVPNHQIALYARQYGGVYWASVIFTDRDVEPHARKGRIAVETIDATRVPTTYRLAVAAVEGFKKHKLDALLVVAAPCHMRRCLRDLRWAADDIGVTIKLMPLPIEYFRYDSAATTWFTRSPWVWWPMEIGLRVVSGLLKGWYKRTRA